MGILITGPSTPLLSQKSTETSDTTLFRSNHKSHKIMVRSQKMLFRALRQLHKCNLSKYGSEGYEMAVQWRKHR
jgi:hypothetical protein